MGEANDYETDFVAWSERQAALLRALRPARWYVEHLLALAPQHQAADG